MPLAEQLTERAIGLAIEVHRHTRPGLLEGVYEQCLCHELNQAGLQFRRQVMIPVTYKGVPINQGFKADIVVDRQVILEIKAIATIPPVHEAQLITYLRMSGIHVGLLFEFQHDAPGAWPAGLHVVGAAGTNTVSVARRGSPLSSVLKNSNKMRSGGRPEDPSSTKLLAQLRFGRQQIKCCCCTSCPW